MKSKRMVLILVATLAVFALAAAQQHSGHGAPSAEKPSQATPAPERKALYWYDAMNPSHHYDKPGKAPDGMDLVPQYAEAQEAAGSGTPGAVKISGQMQQLIGVRTGTVEREALTRDIHTTAQLTTDETQIAHVHVKVNGFIDQVYVDFVGQQVKKGQPLFTLYSPDLVATQQEYLIVRRGMKELGNSSVPGVAQGAESLLRASRDRLRLWDISDEQIQKLDQTGEVSRTLTFYSPVEGFVLDRKAFPQTAVTPDMDLYTVADLSTLWADAAIYEYEAPYVRVGQRATVRLSYQPGKSYSGRISYVYPTVDPQTRTVKVRVALPNPGYELKPQMFAEVDLKIDYGRQLVVPQEAVLDSGQQQTVFVAEPGGHFAPRVVTLGARVDGKVIVLSGLKEGESIVTSGNFLIDSESRLKSAMGGMQH
ncbi:MAG: efflux RND transporter periplasmic adaptor subunit [Acidobacteriia bacterium]|nr:efflux RND transporter periplasmic adaptor subunit [Terriglobia bacterium]